jgi:hypothetical protein
MRKSVSNETIKPSDLPNNQYGANTRTINTLPHKLRSGVENYNDYNKFQCKCDTMGYKLNGPLQQYAIHKQNIY